MRRYFLQILIFSLFLSFGVTFNTLAQEEIQGEPPIEPTFPSCENVQGSLKSGFSEGTHGIVGDTSAHSGSDFVYVLTDSTLIQCFCAIDDSGIQTVWWKVSSLSIEQIEFLLAQGWVYVPNGAAWGLDEDPYLARNSFYDCGNPQDDGKKDRTVSDRDADRSVRNRNGNNDDDNQIGSVLGISSYGFGGQVLGLASTGNAVEIFSFIFAGLASIGLSILLFRRRNAKN
ncbi:LPXTG cell wall anchor domain-containing protein [Patescibacteria group bacterium]